jgi:hypothetical protein
MDHTNHWISSATVPGFFENRPLDIFLKYEKHVVVQVNWADVLPESAELICALDVQGLGMAKIPVDICKFYDDEQAISIMHSLDVDERLVGYAK